MRLPILTSILALSAFARAGGQAIAPLPTLDQELASAKAEAAAADAEVRKLNHAANRARSDAQRLRAQQLAAAQAIGAAEARVTVADTEMRLLAARQKALKARLDEQQRPVSALLAGLAQMAQRPPLLLLAEGGNAAEELVEMRILIAATQPEIQRRTATLRAELDATVRYRQAAAAAQTRLRRGLDELASTRRKFAQLEAKAAASASASDAEAIQAGDAAIAAAETLGRLGDEAGRGQLSAAVAAALGREPAPPPAPAPAAQVPAAVPFPYVLPTEGRILVGLGAVSASGVRSRGVTIGSARGVRVVAPAAGTIRFAGPFQGYDGVVILDHGGGWLSLIVNVATTAKAGDEVELGAALGRALGSVEVELARHGRRYSPALIAGSSPPLSKGGASS